MQPDDIRRSVRASRHDRAAGDAPNMGKVARMPGTGLPKGIRHKKRRSEGGRSNRVMEGRRRIIATWSFLLAGVVVLILGVVLSMWLIPEMTRKEPGPAQSSSQGVDQVKIASKFPSPSEADALALVKQALAVRDAAKVSDYFKTGSATPEAVVGFLKNLVTVDGETGRYEWLASMDANGLSIEGVVVNFKGGDKPRNRFAFLTPDSAGKWQVDFDAFARTVSPSWDALLAEGAEVAAVRVFAARDSYYNGPFADDRQWQCYGIASPDTDEIMQAYCKVGSPQAEAMKSIFSKEVKMVRVTLQIRRVEGAQPRQFEISKVLAEDWVMGAAPFDDRFR